MCKTGYIQKEEHHSVFAFLSLLTSFIVNLKDSLPLPQRAPRNTTVATRLIAGALKMSREDREEVRRKNEERKKAQEKVELTDAWD